MKKAKKGKTPLLKRKTPKEGSSNSMTTTTTLKSIFFRPNNYRRRLNIKRTPLNIRGAIESTYKVQHSPHTKLLFVTHKGILIQVGKKSIIGIYKQNIIAGHKEIYKIDAYTFKDLNHRIEQIKKSIERKIDNALISFARKFKLILPGELPKWSRYEDFIKGEEFIDSIPKEVIIHDTIFKKVYEKGIEFKSSKDHKTPTTHLKTYIKNRAIEDIAPEINKELISINENINPLRVLKQRTKSINDVIKNEHLVRALNPEEKTDFKNWLFETLAIKS